MPGAFRSLSERNSDPAGRTWVYVPYDQPTADLGPLARLDPEAAGIILVESPAKAARRPVLESDGPAMMMEPAERELREDLAPLVARGLLEVVPHEGRLTTAEDFRESVSDEPPFRMDSFYRHVRRRTGLLMEETGPAGGRFSFDGENRQPWPGEPAAPVPPEFPVDEIKEAVGQLVRARPGITAAFAGRCIPPSFVAPRRQPAEGFVRQVLGRREFVAHVHRVTDGFRNLPAARAAPGVSATPSGLGADQPLPPAFWGNPSGLRCLDIVVREVWETGYGHHITRLMVLGNLATLLDVSPRELTAWIWVAYTDAYDWVVEPNVLGMATYATGDLMTTKPYVSGAAYIHRMSDYCGPCAFSPKQDCPITSLYWAFLDRHRGKLEDNPRLRLPYASLEKRGKERRAADRQTFQNVHRRLAAGETLAPERK